MFRLAPRRLELFDGAGVERRAKRRESHIWDSTIRVWQSAGAWVETGRAQDEQIAIPFDWQARVIICKARALPRPGLPRRRA